MGGAKQHPQSFGIKGVLSPSTTKNVNAEEPLPSAFLFPEELQEGNMRIEDMQTHPRFPVPRASLQHKANAPSVFSS